MLTHQLSELTCEAAVLTERQIGTDAILQRREPPLGQPGDVGLRERLEREVRERLPPPKPERRPQRAGSVGRRGGQLVPALLGEALETHRVDPVGVDGKQVSRLTGEQNLAHLAPSSIRLDSAPQVRHVRLERVGRRLRWLCTPEHLEEAIG